MRYLEQCGKKLQLFKGHGRIPNFQRDPNRDEGYRDSAVTAVSCQLMVGLPVLCSHHSAYARDRRRHRGQLIRGFTKKEGKGKKKARENDYGPWSVDHAILLLAIALPPFSAPSLFRGPPDSHG